MTTYNSPFSGDVIQPTDVSYESYTLTASINLYWPINGVPAGFNIAARIMDITTTNRIYQVFMPPANQTSVGQDALISNRGAISVDINDYNGNFVANIPSCTIFVP